jgi:FMN-dependent oxidoreductase (nitrilotriacetate monooxygenase family)
MSAARKQMSLVLFHSPIGRLSHSWRRPTSRAEELMSLDWVKYSAQAVEAAHFDAIFLADKLHDVEHIGLNPDSTAYEPLTTLGALSAVTTHLGLIATVSTTWSQPYNTARMLAQIDFLSGGRAGWNIVTSHGGAQNFSDVLPPKSERYELAEDFLQAAIALWDAWDDDAVRLDREAGVWADTAQIHPPNYRGKHFGVADPLLMPRCPQGRPVLVQAGQSAEGMAFASRNVEVIFTAKTHMDMATSFYNEVNQKAAEFGRAHNPIKILPGIVPILGDTVADAKAIENEVADLYQDDLARQSLSELLLGADLDGLPLDAPIPFEHLVPPEEAATSTYAAASRYPNLYREIVDEKPTLRELMRTRTRQFGHNLIVGTAQTVADEMQLWVEAGACDGFTILPPYMPEGLDLVCQKLVPELQSRGLFRTEYPGTTLRDTLGIERPAPNR